MVSTTVLRNETAWDPPIINNGLGNAFVPIGDRGLRGQSSSSGISRENVQFFNLVEKSAIGCWNIEQAYNENTIDIVGQDNRTLEFPIEIKLDRENDQVLKLLFATFKICHFRLYLFSTLFSFRVFFQMANERNEKSYDNPNISRKRQFLKVTDSKVSICFFFIGFMGTEQSAT